MKFKKWGLSGNPIYEPDYPEFAETVTPGVPSETATPTSRRSDEHTLLQLAEEFVRVIDDNFEMPEETVTFEGVMADWLGAWLNSFKREIARASVPSGTEATPKCPKCEKPLTKVVQEPNSLLNHDQWESTIAGNWFCTCHNNHRGNKPYAYFWDHEFHENSRSVVAQTPQTATNEMIRAAEQFRRSSPYASWNDLSVARITNGTRNV